MPPQIPELARFGAAHAPQIGSTLDAKLDLDGFESARCDGDARGIRRK